MASPVLQISTVRVSYGQVQEPSLVILWVIMEPDSSLRALAYNDGFTCLLKPLFNDRVQ